MAQQVEVLVLRSDGSRVVTVSANYLRFFEASPEIDCLGTTLRGGRCGHTIGGTTRENLPSYSGKGFVVTVEDTESGLTYLTYHCWQHVRQVPPKFVEAFNQPQLVKRLPRVNVSLAIAAIKSQAPVEVSTAVERKPLTSKSTNGAVKSGRRIVVKLPESPAADSKHVQQVGIQQAKIKSEDVDTRPSLLPQKPCTSEPAAALGSSASKPSTSPAFVFGANLSAQPALSGISPFAFASSKSRELGCVWNPPLSANPRKLNVFRDQDPQPKLEVSGKASAKDNKSSTTPKDSKLVTSTIGVKQEPGLSEHTSSHTNVTVNRVEIETSAPASVPSETAKASAVDPPAPRNWEQVAEKLEKELADVRRVLKEQELIIARQELEIKNKSDARPNASDSRKADEQSAEDTQGDAAATAPAETENEKAGLIGEPSDVRTRPSMSMSRGLQTEPSTSASSKARGFGFWRSLDFVLCGCNCGRRYEEI